MIVALGFAAGAAISLLTFAAEHSPPTGGYTLSGNGALVVLALLVPWAVYWGWTWIIARRGEALEMALFILGLELGTGGWALLDAAFFPQQQLDAGQVLQSFMLSGSIFVVPVALVAALTYRLFSGRVPINAWTLFAAGFVAALLVAFYWLGLGILVGMCVAAAKRDMPRRVPIGIALLVLLVVIGNLPFLPAVFS